MMDGSQFMVMVLAYLFAPRLRFVIAVVKQSYCYKVSCIVAYLMCVVCAACRLIANCGPEAETQIGCIRAEDRH